MDPYHKASSCIRLLSMWLPANAISIVESHKSEVLETRGFISNKHIESMGNIIVP